MVKGHTASFGRLAALTVLVSACFATPSAWAQKSAEKAGEDRKAFRESVLAIRGEIDTTLAALNGVADGKDDNARKSALKKYGDELKKMEKQIDKTKGYSKSMKERGQAYFKEWEKSISTVSNETLKASATKRKATLQAQYDKIQASIEKAKQDSSKFWKDLQDLQKYYTNDVSSSAVASSADMVKSTSADGKKIQGYIDEVVKAVDQVGTVVEKEAPAEAAPSPAPAEQGQPPAAGEPAEPPAAGAPAEPPAPPQNN